MDNPVRKAQVKAAWNFLREIGWALKDDKNRGEERLFTLIKDDYRVYSFTEPGFSTSDAKMQVLAKDLGLAKDQGDIAEAICRKILELALLQGEIYRCPGTQDENTFLIIKGKDSLKSLARHNVEFENGRVYKFGREERPRPGIEPVDLGPPGRF